MKKFQLRRIGLSDDPHLQRPSLHDCLEAVMAQSEPLMGDVLKGLQMAIGQAQNKVAQVHSRKISKSTVEELLAKAPAVGATFAAQLRAAIYQSGLHDVPMPDEVSFENLQFLDEIQIDANVEFAVAQQEIQLAVDDVVYPLHALVSSLMGWMTVQSHLNPLRPETFARALRETLLEHVPSDEMRTSLMTPAAGMLGTNLRHLYKELIDWLRSQGVEPVIPVSAGGPGGGAGKGESTASRTMLTLDKLRRLLSGELGSSTPAKDFLHTVPASMAALEDLKMVEPMMKRLSQRAQQTQTGNSPDINIDAEPEQSQSRKLGLQLGEEVIHLMLDNLMRDERLLAPVRAQVKALEPVLLRLSQADPRFFSDRNHPARQFLDKFTHRSLGYVSEDEEDFKAFMKSLNVAVTELTGGEGEAHTFSLMLQSLEAQWTKADKARRPKQEEAARALIHAEQRNLLAHRVAVDFHERLKDLKVPELISVFLCGPWAQVVAQSQLSAADGTADAQGYLALVDDLIWSVQVRRARRNRARLVQLVPALLVKLRQGLQSIQYPNERIPVFFDELIAIHEQAFEGPRVSAGEEALNASGTDEPSPTAAAAERLPEEPQAESDSVISLMGAEGEDGADGFWLGENEAAGAGYLASDALPASEHGALAASPPAWTPANLNVGSWVELSLHGAWVRAQLTWASPHRSLFMFVSGRGLAHSMSRRTMDKLRSRGLMRVVADSHVMDNALDAVARTALRNARGPQR